MKSDLHVGMWTEYPTPEMLVDMLYVSKFLEGNFAYCESFYVVGRRRFTAREATAAVQAWMSQRDPQSRNEEALELAPGDWAFAQEYYDVVIESEGGTSKEEYSELAEADIEWATYDEYLKARLTPLGDYYTILESNYKMWIYHGVK